MRVRSPATGLLISANGLGTTSRHAPGQTRMFHVKHFARRQLEISARLASVKRQSSAFWDAGWLHRTTDRGAPPTGENRLEMLEFVIVSASRQGC
jgi:hypothetical protein